MSSMQEKLHQIYCVIRDIEECDVCETSVQKKIDDFAAEMKKDLRVAILNKEMKKFSDAASSLYKISTRVWDEETITYQGTTYGRNILEIYLKAFVYQIREAMGLEIEEPEEGCESPACICLYGLKKIADSLE